MELHGSLATNLAAALQSANRLRNNPVYEGTLVFWETLLAEAHRALGEEVGPDDAKIRQQVLELEAILIQRRQNHPRAGISGRGDEASVLH